MQLILNLAESIGAIVPGAVTFAITLFSGYLFAIIYRKLFYDKQAETQWLYFVISGLGLMILNYGFDVYHSLISILFVYSLCKWLPGTSFSVAAAFLFLMGHLLIGYHFTNTGSYDIKWTLPQMILTLRLIGLVWDVYDGRQLEENLSEEQKKTAIADSPPLLEIAAYTYFFGSFFVGPQYPLKRFRKFVNGEFLDPQTHEPRNSIVSCLGRLIPGVLYLGAHLYFFHLLSTEYFYSEDFKNESWFMKYIYVNLWYRFIIFRYQAVWLVVEGSCILSGLAYNGVDREGKELWDGVRNIRLTKFELGCTFQSVIDSFNWNTNQWAAMYIFKRLKIFGNKAISHMITLGFLALWHGFYSGYYACFIFQYVCITAERMASSLVNRLPDLKARLIETWLRYPSWVLQKIVTWGLCAYGFLAFAMLTFDRWWGVYTELYFYGYICVGVIWPVVYFILNQVLPKERDNGPAHQD